MVLALEQEKNKELRGKVRQCCSACSIGPRCTKANKIHQAPEQDLTDLFKTPPRSQEQDADSDKTFTPSNSLVSSRTGKKSTSTALKALLQEAVGPDSGIILVKVPFSTNDLEAWERVAREYRTDPARVAKHFKIVIKLHNPDWDDINETDNSENCR